MKYLISGKPLACIKNEAEKKLIWDVSVHFPCKYQNRELKANVFISELFSDEMSSKNIYWENKHEQNGENVASLNKQLMLLKQQCKVLEKECQDTGAPGPQLCFEADHLGTGDASDTNSGVGFTSYCGKRIHKFRTG